MRRKTSEGQAERLTADEKIAVAYFYYVEGISQQNLASIYRVNIGRISEACSAVMQAVTDAKTELEQSK